MRTIGRKVLSCVSSAALGLALCPAVSMSAFAAEDGAIYGVEAPETDMADTTFTTNMTTAAGVTSTVTYSSTELANMAVDASNAPLYYIGKRGKVVYEVTKYIPSSELFKGEGWNSSSTFNFEGRGKGESIKYSYESGKYYPNYLNSSTASTAERYVTTDAVDTPECLALEYKVIDIAEGQTAKEAVEENAKTDPDQGRELSWMANAPESMYSNGDESKTMDGDVFWSFGLGDAIVANISAGYNLPESFTTNSTLSSTATTFTAEQLDEMVVTPETPLYYIINGKQVYKVDAYIPLSKLFAGSGWNSSATFNLEGRTKGSDIPETYEDGMYYPNYLYSTTAPEYSTKDAVATPMCLAVSYQSIDIADGQTAAEAVAENEATAPKASKVVNFMMNTPEAMYTAGESMPGWNFWSYADGAAINATVNAKYALPESFTTTISNYTTLVTSGWTTKEAAITKTYTAAQLEKMVVTPEQPLYYIMNGKTIYEVEAYIPLSALYDGAEWNTGATFNLEGRSKGSDIPESYEDGKYYPNYLYSTTAPEYSTAGAVETPMCLAVSYKSIDIADGQTAAEAVAENARNLPKASKVVNFMMNTPEAMYTAKETMPGFNFWSYADGATIKANVKSSVDLSKDTVTVTVTDKDYNATDQSIAPTVTATIMGSAVTLTEGTNFTVDPATVNAAGSYKFTITGTDGAFGTVNTALEVNTFNIKKATVEVAEPATYNGKAQTVTPVVTAFLPGTTKPITLVEGTDYTVEGNVFTNGGTHDIVINGIGSFDGTQTVQVTVPQATQTISGAKSVSKSFKATALAKKAKSFTVKETAKTAVSYKVVSKNAKLTFKNGKITVKKGTKKGTYKMSFKVTAKATANYKAASKTVKVTVKVK